MSDTLKIYTCKEDDHNKFWSVETNKNTNTVTTKWGRIGTTGQSKSESFSSPYGCERFSSTKINEKIRKGYVLTSKHDFDMMAIQATIIGTANKCGESSWVEIIGDTIKTVDAARLQSPDCVPALRMELNTRKEYGGENTFLLLFSIDGIKRLASPHTLKNSRAITTNDGIYPLVSKVESTLGYTMVK